MLALTSAGSYVSWWWAGPASKHVILWLQQRRCITLQRSDSAPKLSAPLHRHAAHRLLSKSLPQRAALSTSLAEAARRNATAQDHLAHELLQFRYDLTEGNSKAVQQYEDYIGRLPISPRDTFQIARQLHKSVWNKGLLAGKTEEGAKNLGKLLDHYYSGRLPASPAATTILLSICRDCGAYEAGIELWKWAEERGASVVTQSTYGAAIDLYVAAAQNLDACEDVFRRGIKDFSSGFNLYLVSPNAVLSAPEREISSAGVSTSLLAAIAHARLHNSNWTDGYLAIDSALKLRPDRVPTRVMHSVLEKRPLEEALRLFRLVCVGGSKVSQGSLLRLLQKLRDIQEEDLRSPDDRYHHVFVASIVQMNLLHIAIATGQPTIESLMNMSLTGVLVNLPRDAEVSDITNKDLFNDLAIRLKDSMVRVFSAMGLPHAAPQYAMLKVASKLRNKHLFEATIKEVREQNIQLSPQQHVEIFVSALRFADAELLEKTVLTLGVQSKGGSYKKVARELVRQCRFAAELDACRKFYLRSFPDASLSNGDQILVAIKNIERKTRNISRSPVAKSAGALKRQENRILELIERLNRLAHLTETLTIRDLAKCPLPPLSLHEGLGKAPESWQRGLYKEMHLDGLSRQEPYQKKPAERSGSRQEITFPDGANTFIQPALPTGLSHGEARFQLFSGMNEILLLAWGLEHGPGLVDRQRKERTYTEQLEALSSHSSMVLDSEEVWKTQIRDIRNA